MADATGEAKEPPLGVTFDRRLKLEFHGARITSDGVSGGVRVGPDRLHGPSHSWKPPLGNGWNAVVRKPGRVTAGLLLAAINLKASTR